MKVLHLTLKKKWFDWIESGKKKEEYREIKPYWSSRLMQHDCIRTDYDAVEFRNGYSKDARRIRLKCEGIAIGIGDESWGAPPRRVFIIKIGDRI